MHVEHAEKHVKHTENHVEHAGTGRGSRKPSKQHNVNRAGTSLLMAERKQRARHCCFSSAVRMNDAPKSIKELSFSYFPSLNEAWRTAKPGSEHVVDPTIRS